MNDPFRSRLERAVGDDEVAFDHHDIRARVEQRARRRRTIGMALVVAVVGLAAMSVLRDRSADDDVTVASGGEVTVGELTADRWVPSAFSAVTTGGKPMYLEFDEDGHLTGEDVCGGFEATWTLRRGVLEVSDLTLLTMSCDAPRLVTPILGRSPRVGRFDDDPESLKLTAGTDFVAFTRFDRLGVAITSDFEGSFETKPIRVDFGPGGDLTIAVDSCDPIPGRWAVEEDQVIIEADGFGEEVRCIAPAGRVVRARAITALAQRPRVRVDGSFLWLSGPSGVIHLTSSDALRRVDAAIEEEFPVSTTPQGIPVRADLTSGPGSELGAGLAVAGGSLLLGVPFPNQVHPFPVDPPIADDGWTAFLLVTEDLDMVFERYVEQVRGLGFDPRSTNGPEFCIDVDEFVYCDLDATDAGRSVTIVGSQGPEVGQDPAQTHLMVRYLDASDERLDAPKPPTDLVNQGNGTDGSLNAGVPTDWPPLPRVGDPAEHYVGAGWLEVPDRTAQIAHPAMLGTIASVYVVDDGVDPEALLRALAEQTGGSEPIVGPELVSDDGFDVWTMKWEPRDRYEARVFVRAGEPTFLLVEHVDAD